MPEKQRESERSTDYWNGFEDGQAAAPAQPVPPSAEYLRGQRELLRSLLTNPDLIVDDNFRKSLIEFGWTPPATLSLVLTQPSAEPSDLVIQGKLWPLKQIIQVCHNILLTELGRKCSITEDKCWICKEVEAFLNNPEAERPVLPVPPEIKTLILHAKQLLDWVPTCSKGSSGFVRQENLRKSIEEIEVMNATS